MTHIEEKCSFGHDPLWPLHCFVDLSKSDPFSNEIMPCVDAASLSDVGSSVITLAMEEKLINEVCNTILAHLLFGHTEAYVSKFQKSVWWCR